MNANEIFNIIKSFGFIEMKNSYERDGYSYFYLTGSDEEQYDKKEWQIYMDQDMVETRNNYSFFFGDDKFKPDFFKRFLSRLISKYKNKNLLERKELIDNI